ncbi:GNAT family N-acetyltransferase [Suttonella ornithocola]|uniref:Acetyltransferase (GNAT) family n=1 Tax=Suttonella ornithocola TaxID=279832 RepID=A0A380MYS6_9GAMM|nr:GNAT family N-acetyltransferase [Suttonella ornithocola]SUO97705.1 Acetyltransferase (GNAT) family [Suttonella ornithocola]
MITKDNNRFIYQENNEILGEISFTPIENQIIRAEHTYVHPEVRGKGIAGQLLDALADYARENQLKIQPICSYAVSAFKKSDKYQDVSI